MPYDGDFESNLRDLANEPPEIVEMYQKSNPFYAKMIRFAKTYVAQNGGK